jgi:hypothetical protein
MKEEEEKRLEERVKIIEYKVDEKKDERKKMDKEIEIEKEES